MPPRKPNTKQVSAKLKQPGASGMAHVQHVTDANRFEVYLAEVNRTTGEPHPNKVELDKVKREYMDWYEQVDLSDLEMAYYGLLFSTNQIYTGANEITAKFRDLLDERKPDSYLEYYKLVIMGNWLVKNNRLDNISYTRLRVALEDIQPASYVVCKSTDSFELLDLHSSLCYLNNLLHLHNPSEYGTDLMPNDCPPLSELPPTQGVVNQAKLNNTAREAIKQGAYAYSKVAAIPKHKAPEVASANAKKTKKFTKAERKEYYKLHPERAPKSKNPKRIAVLHAKSTGKPAPKEEAYVESPEERDARIEAKAAKNSVKLNNNGTKTLAAENKYLKHLARMEQRASKSIKRAHGEDIQNLKLLVTRLHENKNQVMIDLLTEKYGHLLEDQELINELLDSIYSGGTPTYSEAEKALKLRKQMQHTIDRFNLNKIISKVAVHASNSVINTELELHGHLLDDAALIKEYLNNIFKGEKEPEEGKEKEKAAYQERERVRQLIADARGLLNKFKQQQKVTVSAPNNNPAQNVVVVTKTPTPANNAPQTIQKAAEVISNSYEAGASVARSASHEQESETESEPDMSEFARPAHRISPGNMVSARAGSAKGGNLNAARKEKAQLSKARSKKANDAKKKGRSKKGNTNN